MSSRYSISLSRSQLEKRFQIEVSEGYLPRFNAAPSQLLPVITNTGRQGISFFFWGLAPQWAKNKTISERIINTREELIQEKPLLKKNLRQQRCIIPADGFYEWKKVGKKTMIPYRFVLKSNDAFAMAGLWEEYDDENGEFFHTFTLITTKANALVTTISDRMPVILHQEIEKEWLTENMTDLELQSTLSTFSHEKMDCYTVSPTISNINVDNPTLVKPSPPADQFGNLTLFS